MTEDSKTFTAFLGTRQFASGALGEVALAVKAHEAEGGAPALIFDDGSGAVVDLDLRGTEAETVARLAEFGRERIPTLEDEEPPTSEGAARSRGRPKLGVIAREVTLLPRHWQWLATQPGGASQALRRLVDEARRIDGSRARRRAAQETAYRFLTAMAGDLPGYEEAIRALFADDIAAFAARMAAWPPDIRHYAMKLTASA